MAEVLTPTCAAHRAIVEAYSVGIPDGEGPADPLARNVPPVLAQYLPEDDWRLASALFGKACPEYMVDPFDLPDVVSEQVLNQENPPATFVLPETGHTYECLASNRSSWVPFKVKGHWDLWIDGDGNELQWFELWRNKSNPSEAFLLYPEYFAGKWVVAQFWLARAN